MTLPFVNRELSWLDFNGRVLQEAQDESVPLIERVRFIGIFSNNLDEFFKVRYATVKRIAQMEAASNSAEAANAEALLQDITQKTIALQDESFQTIQQLTAALAEENIFILDESALNEEQVEFVHAFFTQKVSPSLLTILINDNSMLPSNRGNNAFLVARIEQKGGSSRFALIQMPTDLERFVVLPACDGKQYVMLLDDLIRHQMQHIFQILSPANVKAHMVKFTRDAELDFDDDINMSYVEKVASSVRDRVEGDPVRFVYDKNIDDNTLEILLEKFQIGSRDSVIPGGRYHNRRDYIKFPSLGRNDLLYDKKPPLPIAGFSLKKSILSQISQRDF